MKLFNKTLVPISPCGQLQLIHRQSFNFLENRFSKPTVASPEMGICNTCNPARKRFLVDLKDLEDPESCFMQGHDVESIAGELWQHSPDYIDKLTLESEYRGWCSGEVEL
jgi:hypothetical protein